MTILQPLHDIARDQRIILENINRDIANIQKLLDSNPLHACKRCDDGGNISWCEKKSPDETGQHLICITCFNCGIQTIPQNCFSNEPSSFLSAIHYTIEVWNGQVK